MSWEWCCARSEAEEELDYEQRKVHFDSTRPQPAPLPTRPQLAHSQSRQHLTSQYVQRNR